MIRGDQIKEKFNKERVMIIPYVSVLFVLIVTVGITYLFYKNAIDRDKTRFENESTKINSRLENELSKRVTALKASKYLLVEDEKELQNSRYDFIRFSELGILEYVEDNQNNRQNNLKLDKSKLRFKDSSNKPFSISSLDVNLLNESVSEDKIVLSKVEFGDTSDRSDEGYALLSPVYRSLDKSNDQSGVLEGFVYYSFQKKDLLNTIYAGSPPDEIELGLSLDDRGFIEQSDKILDPKTTKKFQTLDAKWNAEYAALPSFFNKSTVGTTFLIPVLGILFGIIVFGFLKLEASAKFELAEIAEKLQEARRQKDLLLESEQKARKAAESSSRMKNEFISTISHEIRTPLNAISGWANILRSENITTETKKKALNTINKNIKTQSEIIDELLLFSTLSDKDQALKFNQIKISKVIENAVAEVSDSADSKNIDLISENHLDELVVKCDGKKLKIAIVNLLTNAIKFTPEGGQVKLTAKAEDSKINLKIKDSGKGIDKKVLPHVFDKFWQADSSTTRKFGGLGLGLAISQQIVKLHGGDINVSSEGENKGTEFSIMLPKHNGV